MPGITLDARAKINLTLEVAGKRNDGYHDIKTVMQSLELCDSVSVDVGEGEDGITLGCSDKGLPADERNLAYRAAEAFYENTGIPLKSCRIYIEKRIPVEAGLAGGSTDAAAVIKALDMLHKTRLPEGKLCETGLSIGADVPYCIMGGTMLAEGIGERLTPLPDMPPCQVVVCKPPFGISTAEAYKKLDSIKGLQKPDTGALVQALEAKELERIGKLLSNQLEAAALEHEELSEIKSVMTGNGALGALMSGSGPSVFGLFSDGALAKKAYDALYAKYRDTFLTKTV